MSNADLREYDLSLFSGTAFGTRPKFHESLKPTSSRSIREACKRAASEGPLFIPDAYKPPMGIVQAPRTSASVAICLSLMSAQQILSWKTATNGLCSLQTVFTASSDNA